ncbi:MAG: hypothetical protein QW743_04750 [Candidatus Methanomethylicia archaeon]
MKCEICGIRNAKYTCINCGCRVCEECLDTEKWMCIKCLKIEDSNIMGGETINTIFKISMIGFLMIFIGIIIIMISQIFMGGTIAGGIVIFPFIPIIFIKGLEGLELTLIVSIIIIIVITLLTFIYILTRKI